MVFKSATSISLTSLSSSNGDIKAQKWRLRESLGRYGTTVIAGGAITCPLVVGLLAVFWGGQGTGSGENASSLWRSIVLEGWVTELATTAAVIIQVCTNAQSIICTSLAAATLLETTGVPLSQVAEFSTMRGANDGPWRYIFLIWSTSIRNFWGVQPLLVVLLFAGTIAIQFTSTILVTDLGVRDIVDYPRTTLFNMSLSDSSELTATSSSQWYMKPAENYASFAEVSPTAESTSATPGLSDTGNIKRYFLPLEHDNRTQIHRYDGPAYGLNSRVACVPPVLDARFEVIDPGSTPLPYKLTMVGNISYERTFEAAGIPQPELCADGVCLPTSFNCSMMASSSPGAQGINMCFPDLSNVIDTQEFTYLSDGRKEPVTAHSMVVLVSRNNGTYEDWTFVGNSPRVPEDFERDGDGGWAQRKLGNDVSWDLSLCFSEFLWELSDITMSTGKRVREPTIPYDPVTRIVDTRAVLRQLGADANNSSDSSRDIFSIHSVKKTTTKSRMLYYLDMYMNAGIFGTPTPPASLTINAGGASYGQSSINPYLDYAAVFEDVLATTNRAAKAVQSTFHIMALQLHYAQLPMLDLPLGNSSLTMTTPATVPVRFNGLAGVCAMVLVNFACVMAITTSFLLKTRYSKQGHFWHTVSQAISEDTLALLQRSTEARDDNLMREALESGEAEEVEVVIARCRKTKRVQVLRKSSVMDASLRSM